MYKIYVNSTPILFRHTSEVANLLPGTKDNPVHRYAGKAHSFLNYLDKLEKGSSLESLTFFHTEIEEMVTDFKSLFKIVAAAGGVVQNDQHQTLFIYRRGHWDLPKGKIEKNESITTAAIREVQEETGLAQVTIKQELPTTWHTYRSRKGKRILKPTYWFLMNSNKETLIPQAEEGIELAVWRPHSEVLQEATLYQSLRDLLLEL